MENDNCSYEIYSNSTFLYSEQRYDGLTQKEVITFDWIKFRLRLYLLTVPEQVLTPTQILLPGSIILFGCIVPGHHTIWVFLALWRPDFHGPEKHPIPIKLCLHEKSQVFGWWVFDWILFQALVCLYVNVFTPNLLGLSMPSSWSGMGRLITLIPSVNQGIFTKC